MCATMAEKITVDFGSCFIFILICLFSLLFYSLLFIKKKPKHSNLPPAPPSLPIIGHLHHILSLQIHRSFHNLSSKYGPLLHLRIFNFPIVLISSGSIAYEIFKSHDINISFRGFPPIDECLMFGSSTFVMSPYGDYWKFIKKLMVTKLLGTQALERSRDIRANELDRLYKNLLTKARNKEIVEIGKEAIKFTNNSICKMIMGRSCSEKNSDRVRGLVTESIALLKQFFLAALLRRQLEKLGISLFKKEITNVSNRFGELLEKVLEEHEEKLNEHQCMDMVDVLLAAYGDENTEYKITRNHIKSLLVDLFIAATDSSGQTTQWTMAEIINNPKILEKLREEIDSVVGKTRLIQETDLPNLPYLQAVVKEGLRLHPPATLLMRKFQEGCNIRGFFFERRRR